MKWDDITLIILAASGCITLLLAQISEVLSRLPHIIRAWRQVRQELNGGTDSGLRNPSAAVTEPDASVATPPGPGGSGSCTCGEPPIGRSKG